MGSLCLTGSAFFDLQVDGGKGLIKREPKGSGNDYVCVWWAEPVRIKKAVELDHTRL